VSVDKYLPVFRRIVLPSFSGTYCKYLVRLILAMLNERHRILSLAVWIIIL
jgi:hypothetical protein